MLAVHEAALSPDGAPVSWVDQYWTSLEVGIAGALSRGGFKGGYHIVGF